MHYHKLFPASQKNVSARDLRLEVEQGAGGRQLFSRSNITVVFTQALPASWSSIQVTSQNEMIELVRQAMGTVKVPTRHDRVYKTECVLSFDTPETPSGLYTSLTTWQSFGADFVGQDFERNGNPLYLKQVWKRVVIEEENGSAGSENGAPTKMAIGVEGGFDLDSKKYDRHVSTSLVIFPTREEIKLPNNEIPTVVTMAIDAILKHDGFERAATVAAAAWEEEDRKESKYAKDLPQLSNGKKISPDPKKWACEESGATDNLWLNLSTGHIGSGRQNWDGTGGSGAALMHFEQTERKYPLVVKLGTITPQGADVYSYAPDEDDMVIDPYLSEHLAHWGIKMQQQVKTEKTITEMQVDLNMSYNFSRITEEGCDLVPLHGPGYVGLENLGNSCYMASVMQILFSIPEIAARFNGRSAQIFKSSVGDPGEDLLVMMAKLATGLLTDRYTEPIPIYEKEPNAPDILRLSTSQGSENYGSIRPLMFKSLVGKGHPEFSSPRQQDASEFYQYFLDKMAKAERMGIKRLLIEGEDESGFIPTEALFGFEVEERIEDSQTSRVKYVTRSENMLSLAIDTEAAVNRAQYEEFEEQKKKRQKLGDESEPDPVQLQVPFPACLKLFAQAETIENFLSPDTGARGTALKRTRFKTYPEYLAVHLKRYYLAEDWTPKKLDVSVLMPDELDLSLLKSPGRVDGEQLMTEAPISESPIVHETSIVPDPTIVSQIMSMGFSENGSKRAAIATKNVSSEASMEWVFAHMEDPDFNKPPETSTAQAQDGSPRESHNPQFPAESVTSLTSMGFTEGQANAALKASGGSLEQAADWLFSHTDDLDAAVRQVEDDAERAQKGTGEGDRAVKNIDGQPHYELLGFASHLGSNTSCGHYVAHIKKDSRFALFNDEKVAVSQNPPTDLGFLYVYRRKRN